MSSIFGGFQTGFPGDKITIITSVQEITIMTEIRPNNCLAIIAMMVHFAVNYHSIGLLTFGIIYLGLASVISLVVLYTLRGKQD